jgi:hypothetical protein
METNAPERARPRKHSVSGTGLTQCFVATKLRQAGEPEQIMRNLVTLPATLAPDRRTRRIVPEFIPATHAAAGKGFRQKKVSLGIRKRIPHDICELCVTKVSIRWESNRDRLN